LAEELKRGWLISEKAYLQVKIVVYYLRKAPFQAVFVLTKKLFGRIIICNIRIGELVF
jgi:hypothetical protein